jgi:antitoxin component YwqK of YwqJK toxin-antitoxin module
MVKRTTWTTNLDVDKNPINRFLSKEITFDNQGRTYDCTEYDENGNVERKALFRYSSITGEILQQIEYDSLNHLMERQEFIENEDGEVYQSILQYADGSKIIKNYELSDLGNAERTLLTDENDQLIGEEIFILDQNDRVIAEIEKDAQGKEILKFENLYCDKGNLIEQKKFEHGHLQDLTTMEYTGNNVLQKKTRLVNGRVVEEEGFVFGDEHQLSKKTVRKLSDSMDVLDEEFYDEFSNLISHVCYTNGKLTFTNTCTYDENKLLKHEYIMEIEWSGKVLRHEVLEHLYENL